MPFIYYYNGFVLLMLLCLAVCVFVEAFKCILQVRPFNNKMRNCCTLWQTHKFEKISSLLIRNSWFWVHAQQISVKSMHISMKFNTVDWLNLYILFELQFVEQNEREVKANFLNRISFFFTIFYLLAMCRFVWCYTMIVETFKYSSSLWT